MRENESTKRMHIRYHVSMIRLIHILMQSSFHSSKVEVQEKNKPETAFSTPYGLFQFNIIAFGLTDAHILFQWLMDNVLKGLQFEIYLIYHYDMVIFSSTFEEHRARTF